MELIGKTKKIEKEQKKGSLEGWLREGVTPWSTMKPTQPLNVLYLCRQLISPRMNTDTEGIIQMLTSQFSAKWKAIKPYWQPRIVQEKIRPVAQLNARMYWQFHPSEQMRRDLVTLSYLCVHLHNKCFSCGNPLKPIGHARKKGANHSDWIGRKYHKECWQEL